VLALGQVGVGMDVAGALVGPLDDLDRGADAGTAHAGALYRECGLSMGWSTLSMGAARVSWDHGVEANSEWMSLGGSGGMNIVGRDRWSEREVETSDQNSR
jgi:hypothetical protein